MKSKTTLALILLFSLALFSYGQNNTKKTKVDSAAVVQPKVIPVVEINLKLESTRQRLNEYASDLVTSDDIKRIDSLMIVRGEFLRKEADEFHEFNPHNLSKFFLENTIRAWEGYKQSLSSWKSVVNIRLTMAKDRINQLNFMKEEWSMTLEAIREANEAEEPQLRVSNTISEIVDEISEFNKQAEYLITLETSVTDAMTFSDNIISKVAQLQQNLRDSLFIAREVPIWKISLQLEGADYFKDRMNKLGRENTKVFRNYFNSLNISFYLIIIVLLTILYYQLRRAYFKLGLDVETPGYVNAWRIMSKNFYPSLISLLILLYIVMFPYNPLAFTAMLILIVLICMRYVLSDFIGKNGVKLIWLLLALMLINQFEIVMWYFSDWARVYLIIESIAVMMAATLLIHPKRRKHFLKGSAFMRNAAKVAYAVFVFGGLALLANSFGYVDLAVLLLKIATQSSIIIIIVYGLSMIFKVMLVSTVTILKTINDQSLQKHLGKIQARGMNIINILAVVFLFTSILSILEIRRPVIDYLVRNLEYKWVIGTMTISIGGVLLLVTILLLTFVITNLIKIIIEEEIAPRVKLPKGVPFAISVTIRYFIMILGFVMALSAGGIDLGEFGLIAGALGIGIGFGLQNIVGNFISGLILIYERPVQNGDTVEVGNLLGEVKRIGIRSSSVRTYDGAEVVVPNTNLVSNELINWTLSDNRRRMEVKVGVAYGSDPNKVLELLKEVALNHEDVLKDPEPRVLFEEFGDSSLNFRLLFWVPYEIGFVTKSDISIGVYNILAENNITIPFPQLDLHVKGDEKKGAEEQ